MSIKVTNETFVQKAIEVHGELYAYELVEYKHSKSKVTIICSIHGEFLQTPNDHLQGAGCPVCGGIASNKERSIKAASEFTTKASIVHNSKYSYELVDYKSSKSKVSIICPEHGVYEQTPNSHLQGFGCAKCANITRSENTGWTRTHFKEKCDKNNNGLGILYILECFNDNEKFYKIGITSRSVKKRYHSKTSMPYLYRIIDEVIGDPVEIYNLEIKLHQINKENQYIPSIPFGGHASECFSEYKEMR